MYGLPSRGLGGAWGGLLLGLFWLVGGPGALAEEESDVPAFLLGQVQVTRYDGVEDDLLTAGLGKSGLAQAFTAPISDPPTAGELRRFAIYNNYRALIDTSDGGGYGTFYGPNVTADGEMTDSEGLIPGYEFLGFSSGGFDRRRVTMLVQVPDSFDRSRTCIVAAPSSGSRGVYGAIGTAGEWGLKKGCAVAYSDKGTGTGAHDLQDDTVGLITGERVAADEAGRRSAFTAPLSERRRLRFNRATPDRFAFKHAHSRRNPERNWGRDVLESLQFAFYVLNHLHPRFGQEVQTASLADDEQVLHRFILPENTIVIASSVSNGGGASVRAAEQDRSGLIDGVAVSEPNVNPRFDPRFAIVQGDGPPLRAHSRSLYDYTTLLNVYQGCAGLDPAIVADAPLNFASSPAVCAELRARGLLTADDLAGQAAEAQQLLNDAGILVEQNLVMPSHWFLNVPQAIAVTYANAYARAGVTRNLCGYSFGATAADGAPAPLPQGAEAVLFGAGNGIPPTGGVNLINNLAPGGPAENRLSTADQNLEGALCLRALATGRDPVTGKRLRGSERFLHRRLLTGIRAVRASGDLKGLPAVFVTGRSDAILPPNHSSRAYVGLNRLVEGADTGLRYYEVTNAQHLDVLNGVPGFSDKFLPLHHYFVLAMDLMFDHLESGRPLPPSQVVRTRPRGVAANGSVPPIAPVNLPPIEESPEAGARIVFAEGELRIPE